MAVQSRQGDGEQPSISQISGHLLEGEKSSQIDISDFNQNINCSNLQKEINCNLHHLRA